MVVNVTERTLNATQSAEMGQIYLVGLP